MRIDFDLVKEILLKIEDESLDCERHNNRINQFLYKDKDFYSKKARSEEEIFNFHIQYLLEEFLVGNIGVMQAGNDIYLACSDPKLTSKGVHFLNQIRDKSLFEKAKSNLLNQGIELSKATLTAVISSYISGKII